MKVRKEDRVCVQQKVIRVSNQGGFRETRASGAMCGIEVGFIGLSSCFEL